MSAGPSSPVPVVSLIAAMSENRVIGRGGNLPWNLPEDLQRFRRITRGHPVILGRKTYDSIGRPLPERLNLVVTRQSGWSAPGVEVHATLDSALERALSDARARGLQEVFVIGGGEIYQQALPSAARIHLTRVAASLPGDAYFPVFEEEFAETMREDRPGPPAYSFLTYERIRPSRGA